MLATIASAAVGGLGSLFGGIASAVQAKKRKKVLKEQKNSLDNWYAQEMSTDFVDSSPVKAALSQMRDNNERQNKLMNNNAVRRGMTTEAQVAMASENNKTYAQNVASLAANNEQKKSSINSEYRRQSNQLDQMRVGIDSAKASALDSFGSLASSFGTTALGLLSSNTKK